MIFAMEVNQSKLT